MKKRNLIILSTVALLLSAVLVMAAHAMDPDAPADTAAMAAANELVEAGHYAEAIQIYEGLVDRGTQDSALFYNLGSAYYLEGDLGQAILNLQRAAQLNPRDPDIRHNLALARAQAQQTGFQADQPGGPLAAVADLTRRWMTLNELSLLALGAWFVLGFLVLAWRQLRPARAPRALRHAAALALILVAVSGAALASRLVTDTIQPGAIIVAGQVALSDLPGEGQSTPYTLSGGTSVNVVETRGNWARLSMPGGVGGWIPQEAVEPLNKA